MTSPFVQFFENVNLSSSYDRLSPHQIWFNLDKGNQSYGGGRNPPPGENVLNRPDEIGLKVSTFQLLNTKRLSTVVKKHFSGGHDHVKQG